MSRKIIIVAIMLFAFFATNAQKNQTKLISSDEKETIIKFELNNYKLAGVKTPQGEKFITKADNTSPILLKGTPDLVKFTESLIIPDIDKMNFEIISSKFTTIDNIEIAPSKGNFTRDIDPSSVPYTYGEAYTKNKFFPGELAKLNSPYIMRDYRGQALQVYPFQYNPVTKQLKIYSEITVKVFSTKKQGKNVLNKIKKFNKISTEFKNIYNRHFINNATYNAKYTPMEEPGNMLIICYDDWTTEMQPLVDWKNKIGRSCEMVTVTEAGGTASAIKTYVENYYNTNGLTYLLLVGDSNQVPTNSGSGLGGDSDNAYAYVTGNDHYLEFFVGRFSAETAAHVSTQVQRTIEYENGSTLAVGWLNVASSVASSAGPGDDGEYDYEHARNMLSDLTTFTYTTPTNEIFDGSQGGNDASGDATAAQVAAAVNSGTGVITYTGHGGDFEWVSSGFDVGDVNALTNDNKLPFIFDVACVNGNFVGQTCFGEAWLRAENSGEPTGAIAICGSTINQSWSPPMIAQDEMVDILVESYASNIKRTYGGVFVNGMFQMNEESSDFAMTDTWTCFGDPSVMLRTDNPATMNITHAGSIIMGQSSFTVNCDFDGALVCLSKNGSIIGTATATGGSADVAISGLTPGDIVDVAVTGFNKVTYLSTANVIAPSGPYVAFDAVQIAGESTMNFGQTDNIDITLKNLGPDEATGVTATVTTTDTYVTSLTNNSNVSFGNIAGDNGTATSSGNFNVVLANNIPDQHVINFDIEITSTNKTTWTNSFSITVKAPVLTIGNITIDDSESGNGDGLLDPNETANVIVVTTNNGHADVTNTIGNLSIAGSNVVINSASTSPYLLDEGASANAVFNVTANDVADGTNETLNVNLTAGVDNQYTATGSKSIVIGFVPNYGAPTVTYEDEYIERVQFETIDNTSGWTDGGYADYSETISTEVEPGQSYPIIVNVAEPYSSDIIICWVDWNYNGLFTDEGEEFTLNWDYSSGIATGNILVPTDAFPRNVRLRIRLSYSTPPEPTGNTSYGEAEDYTLSIIDNTTKVENNESNINIYPNPTNGILYVNNKHKNSEITVYNISGQIVYQNKITNSNARIDLSNNAKGIYIIKINSGNSVENFKVIFE